MPKAIARKVERLFREIIIVTTKPDLYADTGFIAVEDIVKGAGPLGGILTALRHSTGDYSHVVAADMPYPNLAHIAWMMQLLERGDVDAVATREGCGHIEPFNSCFSLRCAPLIEESLARRFSPDWSMPLNFNTRADVERYLSRYHDGRIVPPHVTLRHGCFHNGSA